MRSPFTPKKSKNFSQINARLKKTATIDSLFSALKFGRQLIGLTGCFLTILLLVSDISIGQSLANGGFESNTTYPGTGWATFGTGMATGSILTSGSRTGVNNNTTTFGNSGAYDTYIENSNTITVPSGNYLHVIAWAKISATNATRVIWFSANNSTAAFNPVALTTSFAQYYANIQNTGNAATGLSTTTAKVDIGFNTNNATSRTFNLDDVVAYTDAVATVDLVEPTSATGFTNGSVSGTSVSFTWANGADAGGTGIQNTIVLRAPSSVVTSPTLNDQGIYSVTGTTAGPNLDATGLWTVISTSVASGTTTYTDNTVVSGTSYKYAIIHRDLAFNYSPALVSAAILAITPTQYYSRSTGSLHLVANWTTSSNGVGGTSPTNFTTVGQIFNIRNNAAPTITAAWTVSGTSSNVILGDGTTACNFTIPSGFAFTGPIDIANNGTLTLQNTTIPTLGILNAGSTVNYALATGTQALSVETYGNLTLSGGGARTFPPGIISIAGIFTPGSFTTAGATGTIDFSSASAQNIPAFTYNNLTNSGNGARTLASSGTVGIAGTNFTSGTGLYTVTGSTVNFSNTTGLTIPALPPAATNNYNNLTVSANGTYLQGATLTIGGDYTQSTGTYTVTSGTTAFNFNIAGNFNLTGGTFFLLANTSPTTATTVTVTGNTTTSGASIINLESVNNTNASGTGIFQTTDFTTTSTATSGIINFGSVTSTSTVAGNQFRVAGNFSKSGTGTFYTSSDNPSTGIVFNKSGTQTFSYAGATTQYTQYVVNSGSILQMLTGLTMGSGTNPLSTFIVSGSLNLGTNVLTGTTNPTFTVNSGGTIITANTGGIAASITVPGIKTFTAGAKYEFNSTVANQNMGFTGLTLGNPNSITVSNTFGTVTPDINITFGATATLNINTGAILVAAAARTFTFGTGGIVNVNGTIRTANVTASDALYGTTSTIVSTNTPTINLNTGSTIEFNGAAAQFTSARTFYNMIVSNTGGVTMLGAVTIDNALNLSTANLTIGTNLLTIGGPFTRTSGSLVGSNTSDLTIGGTAGSLFFATGTTNNYLRNFILNNGASATLGNALNITGGASVNTEGLLTISGTATLTTAGLLTIKSSINGTANIAAGRIAGGYISGDVTVERYIPKNSVKSWRLLATNTTGSQTIKSAWQENQTGYNVNTNPGFGTMIAANGASLAAVNGLGFDTLSYGGSIFKYDPATDNLVGIANTNSTVLSSEVGYFLFIRGDRGPNQFNTGVGATPTAPTSSTVLRSTGSLILGNQAAITTGAKNYALLRNPYASRIDLRQVVRTGTLMNAYQVWDPTLSSAAGFGAYQTLTYNTVAGHYQSSTTSAAYGTAGSNHDYVESGSAFFIQSSSAASGSAQVVEAAKTTGSAVVNRPTAANNRLYYSLTANNPSGADVVDGGYIDFDASYSNDVDIEDIRKSSNFGENFGVINSGTSIVVERRALLTATDTIRFDMNSLRNITYILDINPEAISSLNLNAILEDKFLGTSTSISLLSPSQYTFTVNSTPGSFAADRFRIVFKTQAPLPVTIATIRAYLQSGKIDVEWKVENQLNVDHYEIEKSMDGVLFTKVGTQIATGAGRTNITYNWLDLNNISGTNYYRLKIVNANGDVKYSAVAIVNLGKVVSSVKVIPNPVEAGNMNIVFTEQVKGMYQIRLFNNIGQVVYNKLIIHPGSNATQSFALPSQIVRGTYQLEVITPNIVRQVQKIIIN